MCLAIKARMYIRSQSRTYYSSVVHLSSSSGRAERGRTRKGKEREHLEMLLGTTESPTKWQWSPTRGIVRGRLDSILSNQSSSEYTSRARLHQPEIRGQTGRTVIDRWSPLSHSLPTPCSSRIMRKFQFLLNPRQVFNLVKAGPMPG